MTTAEHVALGVLGALTLVTALTVILLIRQIGLLTIRVSSLVPHFDISTDGIGLGESLPAAVADRWPGLVEGIHFLLLLSASCEPCRALVAELSAGRDAPHGYVVVAGRRQLADDLIRQLPKGIVSEADPGASDMAESLAVTSTPFAFLVSDGVVAAKGTVQSVSDLKDLVAVEAHGHPGPTALRSGDRKGP